MDEVFRKLFPGLSFPPRFERFLSGLELSREDLRTASPRKLSDPFSHPGLSPLISKLQVHAEHRRPFRLNSSARTETAIARALFSPSLKDLERLIVLPPTEADPKVPDLPLLDLDGPTGLRYSAPTDREIILPETGPSSLPCSRAGLVFKVGQAWQLLGEDDFNRDYVAFDLETTGISPVDSEIIETGAVKVRNGALGEEFHTLVRPSRPIPPVVSSMTGVTDDEVSAAPAPEEALASFLEFIGEANLIAHNVEFDLGFLRHHSRKLLGAHLTNRTYDTLTESRRRFPGISHRLKNMADHLGIELAGWHRARADARAAALIFLNFTGQDRAPERHAFFKAAVPLACLGALAARLPLEGDNAVFFRYGFPALLSSFKAGEKEFEKRPERKEEVRKNLVDYLSSRKAKKRDLAIYFIIDKMI